MNFEEEELEQSLAICPSLSKGDLLGAQVLQHLAQAGGAERDVVDRAGALIAAPHAALRGAPEILFLVLARHLRARPDVHDVELAEVHPVHREAEVRVRAALHPENARVPVPRGIDVVRGHEEVLDVGNGHALIYIDVHLRRETS